MAEIEDHTVKQNEGLPRRRSENRFLLGAQVRKIHCRRLSQGRRTVFTAGPAVDKADLRKDL